MQINAIIKSTQEIVKHNAPAILTGVAVAGTITTGYLAARAGMQAAERIRHQEQLKDSIIGGREPLATKEKVKIVWPLFMPAVGVGAVTVACALGANHIGGRKAAALAGAYSLSERAFSEYRDKVVEQLGQKKELKVRDTIAQEVMERTLDKREDREIILADEFQDACYETMSGRFFKTSYESIRKAQNDFNEKLLNDGYGSLNEFWDLIGLTGTTIGEELGWTADHLLEVHITTTTMGESKKPCLSLGYIREPHPNFWKFN